MASPVTLPVKLELTSAVVVRPGDRLVLGFANGLDPQQAKDIRQRVSELLPGVEAVILVGATHLAVYQPDETTARS